MFPSLRPTGGPAAYILFYCSSTALLLFYNKWLFTHNPEFSFVLTITWLQQIGVVILLLSLQRPLRPVMGPISFSHTVCARAAPVGILASVDYSFSNLALKIIPMTIYEIVKSCAPAVVLVLSILLGLMQPSVRLTAVVALIVSGAVIAVYRPRPNGGDGSAPPIAVSAEGLVLIVCGAVGSAMKSVAAQMSLHGDRRRLEAALAEAAADGELDVCPHTAHGADAKHTEDATYSEESSRPTSVEAHARFGPVNPITVAFYCGLVMVVALVPIVYVREGGGLQGWWGTVPHATKARNIGFVMLSSVLSILVSVSSFLVMRETSALTYAVVALGERILIVIIAIAALGESLPFLNGMGFVMTLAGIAWYNGMKAAPAGSDAEATLPESGRVRRHARCEAEGSFHATRFDSEGKFSYASAPGATLFVPPPSECEPVVLDGRGLSNVPTVVTAYGSTDATTAASTAPSGFPTR